VSAAGHGNASGWHYATREAIRVRWEKGLVTGIEPVKLKSPAGRWIAPGLVDLQVNGFGGVDFQRDDLRTEDLLKAVRRLRAAGCARFLATLITDEWSKMLVRLRRLRRLRSESGELCRAIAGWHIEGPFLSDQAGFRGAHDGSKMLDPAPELIRELRSAAGGDPVLLTLAPERAGALEAIRLAVSLGIRVSLGHSNASADRVRQAIAAGAAGFTHLGNGCPRELDRHDNILWRVLDSPGLVVSLIPDAIHVSPALFRLTHRLMRPDSILYVTDAMAAAGAPPGRYSLGKLDLEVGADQVVRQPGTPFFAGSALRPIDGVFRAAQMLNLPWQETWGRFSEKPAAFMGLQPGLAVGQPPDFRVISVLPNSEPSRIRVIAGMLDQTVRLGGGDVSENRVWSPAFKRS
jgi:N-acetylglucosamine-6-phosphate deacetylase